MAHEVYRIRSWRFTRRLVIQLLFLPVSAVAIFFSLYLRTSPYPAEDALRHLIAAKGCVAAQSVGLAPASEGALGYHAKNDPDRNGVACDRTAAVDSAQAEFRGGAKFIRP